MQIFNFLKELEFFIIAPHKVIAIPTLQKQKVSLFKTLALFFVSFLYSASLFLLLLQVTKTIGTSCRSFSLLNSLSKLTMLLSVLLSDKLTFSWLSPLIASFRISLLRVNYISWKASSFKCHLIKGKRQRGEEGMVKFTNWKITIYVINMGRKFLSSK